MLLIYACLSQTPGHSIDCISIGMMENTGYDSLTGNPNAPWINFAATTYGLATSYFGVTHPGQPNYIAATSGSTKRSTCQLSRAFSI